MKRHMNFMNYNFFQKHKSLLQNTIFVFALNALQRIFGLATAYVLVRTLDQNQFGDYQFILSLVGVLTIFSLPGLNNAVMQSTARGKEGTFRLSLKPALLSSAFGSLILLCIGSWFLFVESSELYLVFFLASVLFPFAHSLKQWKSFQAGKEKFSSLFVIEGAFSLLTALLVIGISVSFPGAIIWPLLVVMAVPAVQNLIFTGYLLKKISHYAAIEEESIRYGLKTTVYSSFNIIANHLDKLLIYGFVSPASLALYFVAERMSELTKSIGQNFASVLAPRFAKTERYTDSLDKILNLFTIVLGAGIILFAFTALPWVMEILFGENYIEAIPYAQALLCTVAVGNHASLRNIFVNSKLDEKSNRDVTISISLIRIIASAVLVPLFGIIGAVISTFIYRASTVLILHHIIKTRYKLSRAE